MPDKAYDSPKAHGRGRGIIIGDGFKRRGPFWTCPSCFEKTKHPEESDFVCEPCSMLWGREVLFGLPESVYRNSLTKNRYGSYLPVVPIEVEEARKNVVKTADY